ncbi:hypothetical protein RD792_006154 [Penstemon davidsonii]|uniref:Uncharacterized protein n=1 Tax=Penstemon davidsonii TaxID=160366 RepID=A0ABR0DEJ4_9LAMI|nr:hypothetical protein RD792_006154 [Penstemon davidsonii]
MIPGAITSVLSKDVLRRQRHAVLSTEERRSRLARCQDTDVPSIVSANGSVDCDYGEFVSAYVPAVSPSCSGSELMPDVSVGSVLVNDLSASLISSDVRLCAGVHSDLPRGSSVSLNCYSEVGESSVSASLGSALEVGQISGATFELGETSNASVGLLNGLSCLYSSGFSHYVFDL